MECNEDNCPIMLGMQNLFYEFMLGKPYKEREHNTAPPGGEAQKVELKTSSLSTKDRVLGLLRVGELQPMVYKQLLKTLQSYYRGHKQVWPKAPSTNKRLSLYEALVLGAFDNSWYEEALK